MTTQEQTNAKIRAAFEIEAKNNRDTPKPNEQLEQAAKDYKIKTGRPMVGFIDGGLKGMEIQKEIDRQEIDRLKSVLKSITEENYDDDDGKQELRNIIDELKRFANEKLKP